MFFPFFFFFFVAINIKVLLLESLQQLIGRLLLSMCFYLMLYHHNPSFFQNSQLGIFPLKNSTNYEQKYQNLVFSPKHETKPQPKFGKPFHDMVYLLFIIFLVQTTFILHLPKINPLKTSTKIKHKNPTKF